MSTWVWAAIRPVPLPMRSPSTHALHTQPQVETLKGRLLADGFRAEFGRGDEGPLEGQKGNPCLSSPLQSFDLRPQSQRTTFSPFRFGWPSEASRWVQDGPRGPQESPNTARGPKRLPRGTQDGPRNPRGRQDAPRTPQEASKKLARDISGDSERHPRGLWPFCLSSPPPRPPPPPPPSPSPTPSSDSSIIFPSCGMTASPVLCFSACSYAPLIKATPLDILLET